MGRRRPPLGKVNPSKREAKERNKEGHTEIRTQPPLGGGKPKQRRGRRGK